MFFKYKTKSFIIFRNFLKKVNTINVNNIIYNKNLEIKLIKSFTINLFYHKN